MNVTVVDATPPVADAGDNHTIQPGTTVYFDGSDSSDNIQVINYTWSFLYNRMNIKLYGENTSFTFHIMDNYTVTLVVKDLFDLEGLDNIFVNVIPEKVDFDDEKPNADAGENLTVDKNSTVQLNSGGSWDNECIVNYTWIIEYDGSNITLNRTNAIYRFEKIGVYNVTLRVEDAAGNVDEDRIMIIVTDHGNDEPDDDTALDVVPPDDTDPGDEGGGREGASSIYLWVGIILLMFLGVGIGIAIVIIRKKTSDNSEPPPENEFGRTGNEG